MTNTSQFEHRKISKTTILYCSLFYITWLLTFSYLIKNIANTYYITSIISYFVNLFIFYLWHIQAHNDYWFIPFNKVCRKYHNIHHYVYFPKSDFYGEMKVEWKKNKENLLIHAIPLNELYFVNSLQNEGFAIILGFIVAIFEKYVFKLTNLTILLLIIQSIITNYLGNYLHLSFHNKDSWLNKYEWFKDLKYLHYLHHCGNTKHNYMLVYFTFDKMFNSYLNCNPNN